MLVAKLVIRRDLDPLITLLQVEHLYLTNIWGTTKLVKIAILHDNEARCASALIQAWQHGPLILGRIIYLTSLGALCAMPRTYSDDVAVCILCDSVSISLIVHVLKLREAPGWLIEHTSPLQISLSVCDGAASHVDSVTHLNALLVPQWLESRILNQSLLLSHSDQIKDDDVVLIEQMQASVLGGHFDPGLAARHLHLVEEVRQLLEVDGVSAAKAL